jgi:cytochrome P450
MAFAFPLALLREGHRDRAAFEPPDAYRPCRFATTAPASRNYAPFGLGEHRCVAAEFVVDFATMCVEELFDRGSRGQLLAMAPAKSLLMPGNPLTILKLLCGPVARKE